MDSPHTRILANCVRVFIGVDAGPPGPGGEDWRGLLELAEHHNLMPQLVQAQSSRASQSGPPELAAHLAAWQRRWTRASLTLSTELARLLGLLSGAGIRAMPLKGPVLAHLLYGDPGARQYSDLDIIVEPEARHAALEVFANAGYEPKWPASARARHERFNWYDELPLARNGVDLDLHWSFSVRHYVACMDGRAVWSRAERVEFLGRAVEVPAPEDYLEFLCLHGSRHGWSRLGWLADIAAFHRKFSGRIGLPSLVSRSSGGELIVDGLRRAYDWLGLPAAGLDTLAPPPVPAWSKLRYRAAQAILPTEADWAEVDLPPWLEPLYYPLRVARLTGRGIGRLVQRGLRRLD